VYACRWIENGYIEIQTDRWIDWNIKRHGEGKQKQTTSSCNWNLLTSTLFLFFANQTNTTKKKQAEAGEDGAKDNLEATKKKKEKDDKEQKEEGEEGGEGNV